MSDTDYPPRCVKRAFRSANQAKRAHRHAGFRIRPYRCVDCGSWHVTNQDKRDRRLYRDERE